MGPAAPNPNTPRAMGAAIGIRRTPAQAPAAAPATRRRLSKWVELSMTYSWEGANVALLTIILHGEPGRSLKLLVREIQALNGF